MFSLIFEIVSSIFMTRGMYMEGDLVRGTLITGVSAGVTSRTEGLVGKNLQGIMQEELDEVPLAAM